MKTFYLHSEIVKFVPPSVKEWLCALLLLMSSTMARKDIFMEITDFSHSQVELSCHGIYDSNVTDVFFDVYEGQSACLHSTTDWCREYMFNHCGILCMASVNQKTLPFLVKLDGRCDEIVVVRCMIRSADTETILDLEESIKLTSQSDPPLISVNNGQPVEASPELVQVICTINNRCNKTEVDLLVNVPIQHVSTTHTTKGDRFTTTAVSTALFSEPGSYTIVCKEKGKDDHYARNVTLVVDPGEKVTQQMENDDDKLYNPVVVGILTPLLIISTIAGFTCSYMFWKRTQRRKRRYKDIMAEIMPLLTLREPSYPKSEHSSIYQLIEKMDDLYRKPSYRRLIKELFPSYQRSDLSKKEDLSKIIWNKLGYHQLKNETDAQECMEKLNIFLPLDAGLSLRLLWRCALDSIILQEKNVCKSQSLEVLKLLITEAARFTTKIHQLSVRDRRLSQRYLQEIFEEYLEMSEGHPGVLNFSIESVPSFVLEDDSEYLSSIKGFIVEKCLKMIANVPDLCNHVDTEGRTAFHNLMNKIFKGDLWKKMPEQVEGTDNLWNLLSKLITDKNVNTQDKHKVTPYSWILLWKESVSDKKDSNGQIETIMKECQENAANDEEASNLLVILREKEMELLLQRLFSMQLHTTTEEILFTRAREDLKRLKDLKEKGCGECVARLSGTSQFADFTKEHLKIVNDKILHMSEDMLEVMIDEGNAQRIYDIVIKQVQSNSEINYFAAFGVLKNCLDRGVCPAIDEICEISLLNVDTCATYEARLATIHMMEHLIGAYRKEGNTNPVEIYLNPIQDQWEVTKELRTAASAVIRAAYCTLSNCVKSGSVVNTLLFLSNSDSDDGIENCFHRAEELLKDMNKTPVTKSTKEKKEITLLKRNNNWLKRSVLHMVAIFWHDEKVLECIPKELLKQINAKDVHGCTPLHTAYLHGNMSAAKFLESTGAKLIADYFGKSPKSLESRSAEQHNNICVRIADTKSSVFDEMKSMLVLPVKHCAAIEKDLQELFSKMVATDGLLNAEIFIGGNVREKLKLSSCDEFDMYVCVKTRPYSEEPLASLKFHEYLFKRLAEIDRSSISLRCISLGNPIVFIREQSWDNGHQISVNFVLISAEGNQVQRNARQELVIDNAPDHQNFSYLKSNSFKTFSSWHGTLFEHEWDILDGLPPGCRLGILVAMTLLKATDETPSGNSLKRPITKTVLKNTLLWILAGKTPGQIECQYGNVIAGRYGALRLQLHFTGPNSKWMTGDDLEKYKFDGRFWAEKIFDAIMFMAKNWRVSLSTFLADECDDLNPHEVTDVQHTCESCLEKLRPEVFFSKEACASSEMTDSGKGLRTRLQKEIDKLKDQAQEIPAALLWKKKKEVNELKLRIDRWPSMKTSLKEKCRKLENEIDQIQQDHADEETAASLQEKERDYEQLEGEIQKLLEKLGKVDQKESEQFKLRGKYEGMIERKKNVNSQIEIETIKGKLTQIEGEINQLRGKCVSDLKGLEETVFQTLSNFDPLLNCIGWLY